MLNGYLAAKFLVRECGQFREVWPSLCTQVIEQSFGGDYRLCLRHSENKTKL